MNSQECTSNIEEEEIFVNIESFGEMQEDIQKRFWTKKCESTESDPSIPYRILLLGEPNSGKATIQENFKSTYQLQCTQQEQFWFSQSNMSFSDCQNGLVVDVHSFKVKYAPDYEVFTSIFSNRKYAQTVALLLLDVSKPWKAPETLERWEWVVKDLKKRSTHVILVATKCNIFQNFDEGYFPVRESILWTFLKRFSKHHGIMIHKSGKNAQGTIEGIDTLQVTINRLFRQAFPIQEDYGNEPNSVVKSEGANVEMYFRDEKPEHNTTGLDLRIGSEDSIPKAISSVPLKRLPRSPLFAEEEGYEIVHLQPDIVQQAMQTNLSTIASIIQDVFQ